jgi:hypothetical protein
MTPSLKDYRDGIEESTKGFTGREWVFQAIDDWLADVSGSRSFIISGDPGCGKTALAARLVQMGHAWEPAKRYKALGSDSLASYHFCQAQSDRTLNPLRFIESLSRDLANHNRAFGHALTRVKHGEITVIHATQTIGSAATGVVATNLAIESLHIGVLDPRVAFDEIVRRPLESLNEAELGGPILILVDALDETLTFHPTNNLVDLLSHIGDLPRQVRWLFTSRRDSRVLDRLSDATLDLVRDEPPELEELQTYVHEVLTDCAEPRRRELARLIATAAKGNFLYARYVATDLMRRAPEVSTVNGLGLPKDLAGHYRQFLQRELASSKKDYYRRYRPVLGLIAVSRGQGLNIRQIVGITGISDSDTREILLSCEQYLSGSDTTGSVQIYHQSFREFLLQDSTYNINGPEANAAIAKFFLKVHGNDWSNCREEYAWRYTAVHLALAIEQLNDPSEGLTRKQLSKELAALLNDPQFLITNFCLRTELFPSRREGLRAGAMWARRSDGTLRGERRAFERISQWLTQSRSAVCSVTGGAGIDCSGIISRWIEHVHEQGQQDSGSVYARLRVISHFCTPAEPAALAFLDLAHQLAGHYQDYAQALADHIRFDTVPELTAANIEQWIGWSVVDALRRQPDSDVFLATVQKPLEGVFARRPGERIVLAVDSVDAGFPIEPLLAQDLLGFSFRLLLTCSQGSRIPDFVHQLVPDAFVVRLDSSPSEILETLSARPQDERAERLAGFDTDALIWLALPPVWTVRLAEACVFPSGTEPLKTFLTRAEAAGLCQLADTRTVSGQAEKQFWMPSEIREAVISEVRARGQTHLQESVRLIGRRVLEASSLQKATVPTRLERWAMLSDRVTSGEKAAAGWLDQTIQHLLDAGETSAAQSWLETVSLLGQTLGGDTESAATFAAHRIMLALRIQGDRRQLRSYLVRRQQIADVDSLLHGPAHVWALHILGPGGMGKTSLLRYIASDTGLLAASRVDFDYLSPDFPSRRPGELLMAFGTDLQVFCTSELQERLFRRFRACTADYQLAEVDRPSHTAPNAIDAPGFQQMLHFFCDFVETIRSPVVFMLDTCEELQKLQTTSRHSPAVSATFSILAQVHERVPTIRVILAGRRLLARSGHGWTSEGNGTDLAVRPYLRLHAMQAFDESEALSYVGMRPGAKLSRSLTSAILQASKTPVHVPPVTFKSGTDVIRYNPFDLALYTQRVLDDPTVTPEHILAGGDDDYISLRIVRRIVNPGVKAYLPAAVLLRRFDGEMLRCAGTGADDFEQIFQELGDQEWMRTTHDFASGSQYLSAEPSLVLRLERYYRRNDIKQLERIRQRLGPALAQLVHERPLYRLNVALVSAALRLMSDESAAALWADLQRRIAAEEMWQWAEGVTRHLLGEDSLSLDAASTLRESVMATHESARSHARS